MDGTNELLQLKYGGAYVDGSRPLQKLSVVSVEVVTNVKTIDEFRYLFCTGNELFWPENTS